jgi:hypothetical protein
MELQEGETIVASVRQHWFIMVRPIVVGAIVVVALVAIGLYFQFDFFGYSSAVYLVTGLVILLFLLYKSYLWRKNELIITNFRIINHQQRGLLSQTVTELLYRDITDISFTQDGASAMAFDYGTLIIRLPSQDHVQVEIIPQPSKIIETINRVRMGNFDK